MIITAEQQDALTEWVNIGFGRAAGSLSDLLGQRIYLQAPAVTVLDLTELYDALTGIFSDQLVVVHQMFSGGVSGDILLFLDFDSASILVDLLSGGTGRCQRLNVSDREALLEVGNILLNAYVGSFGNMLQAKINFTLPNLHLDTVKDISELLSINSDQLHFILLVKTEFSLLAGNVSGYIALIVGINSLETLIQSIHDFVRVD